MDGPLMSRQRTGLGPVHVGDNCVAWSVCGDICREKGEVQISSCYVALSSPVLEGVLDT